MVSHTLAAAALVFPVYCCLTSRTEQGHATRQQQKALQLLCYVSQFDSTDYATHNSPLYQCYTK